MRYEENLKNSADNSSNNKPLSYSIVQMRFGSAYQLLTANNRTLDVSGTSQQQPQLDLIRNTSTIIVIFTNITIGATQSPSESLKILKAKNGFLTCLLQHVQHVGLKDTINGLNANSSAVLKTNKSTSTTILSKFISTH
jgi:hypothetical protein